jgi:ATP-binding cassette subfamily B protein
MPMKRQLKRIDLKQYFRADDFKKTFSLLAPFVLQHRKAYFALFSFLFIEIALTLAFAWFFGNITEAAVQSDFNKMKWLVPLGISFVLVSISTGFFYTYFESIATNGVKRELKNQLLKHVMRLPVKKASNLHSGELLSHFSNDINSINGVIGSSLINLIRLPLIFIAVFIYLVHLNWKLTIFSVFVLPLAILASVFFGLKLRQNSRLIHSLLGRMNHFLNETFQGFQVIRSFTMEKLLFKKYEAQNRELYSLEIANAKLSGWFQSGGQLISSITYLVSLCLGAYYVSIGMMTVGALLTFVSLVNHLVYPLTGLAGQWAGFQRSVTAVERIVGVLEEPTDSMDLPSYTPTKKELKSIQFQNISFSYDEDNKLFEQFDLQIPAGKVVAFVGPSGAGKSTLFNLLHGFYRPHTGGILVDGILTEDYSLSELRSSMAHVSQETFLFAGTIRENLMLARPEVSEEEMIGAAIHANIHDFILSLPKGYDTEIGERGVRLSGGQKQRIAIARAILKDAPILLLDEATSALDGETEFYVKQALDGLMKDRTTLVIAHRLSTVQTADLIVVMDNGQIVQMGSHEELVSQSGLYRKLHSTQFSSGKTAPLSLVSN